VTMVAKSGPADVGRERLVRRLRLLCDEWLPDKAEDEEWPVRFGHCFRRLAYDNACGDVWYGCVDGDSFVNDATVPQLEEAVEKAVRMYRCGPEYAEELQEKSLLWRGELEPQNASVVDPEKVIGHE